MYNERIDVYTYFTNCKSQVKLSTYVLVGGVVNHDYVVVHEAPPRVVSEIVTKFKLVSLGEAGLVIPLNRQED